MPRIRLEGIESTRTLPRRRQPLSSPESGLKELKANGSLEGLKGLSWGIRLEGIERLLSTSPVIFVIFDRIRLEGIER